MRFHQKIVARISAVGNHVCIGIDPHRDQAPAFLDSELNRLGGEKFLMQLSRSILDGADGVAAVKFQSAFFEAYGSLGVHALEVAIKDAKHRGFVTILDAKRGDISSTMKAYGAAAFDRMNADSLTVTAYMGTDVLAALKSWGERGFGAYVVWISSNPSGGGVQGSELSLGKITVADKLQQDIDAWELSANVVGMTGYVLGATKLNPQTLSKLGGTERFFLMPGVGAQGGKIDATLQSILSRHPGTLVSMSRSLTGLGSGDSREWSSITTWTEYTNAVSQQCKKAKLDLMKSSS